MAGQRTAQHSGQRGRASTLFNSRRKNRNLHFIHALCGAGTCPCENGGACHIVCIMCQRGRGAGLFSGQFGGVGGYVSVTYG
jgi:hypothetical protein